MNAAGKITTSSDEFYDLIRTQQELARTHGIVVRYHRLRDHLTTGTFGAFRAENGRWRVPSDSLPALAAALARPASRLTR